MADTEEIRHSNTDDLPPTQGWLSMLGGLGLTVIIVGLIIGVVDPAGNSSAIGLLVLTGFACLLGAILGWIAVGQPHKHFDDINVPQYHGDHHEAHHDDHSQAAQH